MVTAFFTKINVSWKENRFKGVLEVFNALFRDQPFTVAILTFIITAPVAALFKNSLNDYFLGLAEKSIYWQAILFSSIAVTLIFLILSVIFMALLVFSKIQRKELSDARRDLGALDRFGLTNMLPAETDEAIDRNYATILKRITSSTSERLDLIFTTG